MFQELSCATNDDNPQNLLNLWGTRSKVKPNIKRMMMTIFVISMIIFIPYIYKKYDNNKQLQVPRYMTYTDFTRTGSSNHANEFS